MVLGTLWGLHPEAPIRFQSGGHLRQNQPSSLKLVCLLEEQGTGVHTAWLP